MKSLIFGVVLLLGSTLVHAFPGPRALEISPTELVQGRYQLTLQYPLDEVQVISVSALNWMRGPQIPDGAIIGGKIGYRRMDAFLDPNHFLGMGFGLGYHQGIAAPYWWMHPYMELGYIFPSEDTRFRYGYAWTFAFDMGDSHDNPLLGYRMQLELFIQALL